MCCDEGRGETSAAAERLYNILGDISLEQWEGFKQTGRPLAEIMQYGVMSPGSVSDYDLRKVYQDRYGVRRPKESAAQQKTAAQPKTASTTQAKTSSTSEPAAGGYFDSGLQMYIPEGHVYVEGAGLIPITGEGAPGVTESQGQASGPPVESAAAKGDAVKYRDKNAPSFAEWKKSLGIGSMLVNPDYEGAAARAGATVGQVFQAERGNSERRLASMGVDPRSGRYAAFDNQLGLREAAAKAGAMNLARRQEKQYADTTNWNRKVAVSGTSSGQASGVTNGLANAAGGLANMAANQQAAAAQQQAGLGSLIGTSLIALA